VNIAKIDLRFYKVVQLHKPC